MATAREYLTDTSDRLRLAVSDLTAVDGQVASLTAGVGELPMSEAAARVKEAARMAGKEAARVLEAAEAAEAAATNAAKALATAEAAEAAAAEAAEAAAAAAAAAKAAKAAVAPLNLAARPPLSRSSMRLPGGGGASKPQGASSPSGWAIKLPDSSTAVKEGRGLSKDYEGDRRTSTAPAGDGGSGPGAVDRERQEGGKTTPADGGKELHEADREEDEEEADEHGIHSRGQTIKGKRKLQSSCEALPPESVLPVGGLQQQDHVESPSKEASKRQRKDSAPAAEAAGGGRGGAAAAPRASPGATTGRQSNKPCCREDGCTTRPSYNFDGSKKPMFCSKHSKKGMLDVVSKRCAHPGCNTIPTYGVDGSKKREFCFRHAEEGMIDVVHKRCGDPECTTIPTFGIDGSNKAEFCSKHARGGMVNVKDRRCCHPGCTTIPTYAFEGSKKAEFCSKHAEAGMVNVRRPKK